MQKLLYEGWEMGLFFRKKPRYDEEISTENKKRLREIFNDAVPDGESYRILYAGATDQAFSRGLLADARATTFHNYIVGYRREDFEVVIVEIDRAMIQYAEPLYIDIDEIKETKYNRKIRQAWFVYKNGPAYGIKIEINDSDADTRYMIPNLHQEKERELFLNFFERYTNILRKRGYTIPHWKR